jgi:hypothetical protein
MADEMAAFLSRHRHAPAGTRLCVLAGIADAPLTDVVQGAFP